MLLLGVLARFCVVAAPRAFPRSTNAQYKSLDDFHCPSLRHVCKKPSTKHKITSILKTPSIQTLPPHSRNHGELFQCIIKQTQHTNWLGERRSKKAIPSHPSLSSRPPQETRSISHKSLLLARVSSSAFLLLSLQAAPVSGSLSCLTLLLSAPSSRIAVVLPQTRSESNRRAINSPPTTSY